MVALAVFAASIDVNLVGNHKYAVKADSKLSDKPFAQVTLSGFYCLHKRFRARVGDCPEILYKLFAGHADAAVFDRESVFFFVESY